MAYRIAVPLSEEVQQAYEQMAQVLGKSVGSTISDWLEQTLDAARMMTMTVERAKESPARAMRELQQVAAEYEERLTQERWTFCVMIAL